MCLKLKKSDLDDVESDYDDEDPDDEYPLEDTVEANEVGNVDYEAHSEPESPLGRGRQKQMPTTSYTSQMGVSLY